MTYQITLLLLLKSPMLPAFYRYVLCLLPSSTRLHRCKPNMAWARPRPLQKRCRERHPPTPTSERAAKCSNVYPDTLLVRTMFCDFAGAGAIAVAATVFVRRVSGKFIREVVWLCQQSHLASQPASLLGPCVKM